MCKIGAKKLQVDGLRGDGGVVDYNGNKKFKVVRVQSYLSPSPPPHPPFSAEELLVMPRAKVVITKKETDHSGKKQRIMEF